MYTLAFLAFVSFLVAFLVTPLVRDGFKKLGMVDVGDGGRKVHVGAIPRVGGVAVLVAYLGAFGLLVLVGLTGSVRLLGEMDLVLKMAPAAGLVFFCGLMDDLWGVGARVKFVVQVAAGLVAYWAGVRVASVGGVNVEEVWWALPLTVFWLVLCTNALNLIDGVDGLASGVGVFAALTAMAAGMLQGNYALVMATAPLAGALIGFLRYNFSPASIFLGDSGSYLVGFLLGCYGLLWSQKAATILGMTAPLMALAIPLMDTGLSVVRRFLRGQPLFGADRGHIHHKLLERGWTVRRAVLVLYGACGLAAVLSLAGSAWQGKMTGLALVVFAVAAWLGVQNLGYAELSTAGKMIRPRGFRRLLGAELALKTMKEGLEKAGSGEEVWAVVMRGVKELGYSSVVMELDGRRYGEWTGEEGEQWRLVVPLDGRGRLELGHGFHVNGVATVTHPLAMMVREALGERREEVKG